MRIARLAACLAALAILLSSAIQTNAAGALATGRCGAFGYSFDEASPEAAAMRARAQCKGAQCKVVTSFRRACAAVAIDAGNACGPHGWAQAETLGRAQNIASQQCNRFGGRNCMIRAWVCDAKG
ncbi:MAG TPA: DUF4189 domain-containing protein [Xanthobacteraceae bacterium]|nr:DUF4189 domain-containing protein [Xanthobacteraceae bacterium]